MNITLRNILLTSGLLVISTLLLKAQDNLSLIPKPNVLYQRDGNFKVSNEFSWYAASDSLATAGSLFFEQLKLTTDINVKRVNEPLKADLLIIKNPTLKPGAYTLDITKDKIRIRAGMPDGVFYAFQTLLQLFPPEIFGNSKFIKQGIEIPCLWIEDSPRFPYRGMHLDVCRHFFPKEFIMKYIDYLAMHKMNYFHWHLTDDQGWRIEIKKYPKLVSIGSKRKETLIGSYNDLPHRYDNTEYSGYFTQEDIKEVISYASKRFVTIIPEIEMPGHALAALAAYPELSCNGGSFSPATTWGVFDDVFCPKESTFDFLENVLAEVIELFPGPYIHIGGDECPKVRWKSCSHCQELMRREGLKSEEELQSYFVHRIEKYINSKGKKIIGWDEILEGGLAPNATVMSWRGTKGGIEAAKQNHDVIMTPGSHCYFDHYQSLSLNEPIAIGGYTSVMKVYNYEPIPSELNEDQAKHILGAQGNLWTEYILNPKHVEYMALPRMSALAEVDWSMKSNRNEGDFKMRLNKHLLRLKAMDCNFAKHILDPEVSTLTDEKGNLVITIIPANTNDKIRYSIENPVTTNSSIYEKPVVMDKSGRFYYQTQNDLMGSLLSLDFEKSKSFGKTIILEEQASERYPGAKLEKTLTDGLRGGKRFNGQNWLGFSGKDLKAVIDLRKAEEITTVSVGSLQNKGAWVKAPKSITVWVSDNGTDFTKQITQNALLDSNNLVKTTFKPINTRYIKVYLENGGLNDPGDPGAGQASWLFVDEIIVN